MKKTFRVAAMLFLSAASLNVAWSENNVVSPELGVIRGRVVDAGKHVLPGASIYVENLKTGVIPEFGISLE